MPLSVGLVLVFMLGVACGIRWVHASRLDKIDKLVRTLIARDETIAQLRAELGEQRRTDLFEWLFEDGDPA